MSATQFRDQLAISCRYHKEPCGLPAVCDGCGAPSSLQHGLDCAKGDLVKRGLNDLRDSDALLADAAWGGDSVEPVMVPARTTGKDRTSGGLARERGLGR